MYLTTRGAPLSWNLIITFSKNEIRGLDSVRSDHKACFQTQHNYSGILSTNLFHTLLCGFYFFFEITFIIIILKRFPWHQRSVNTELTSRLALSKAYLDHRPSSTEFLCLLRAAN